MAIVHPTATISPTKAELAQKWLAEADWFDGDPNAIEVRSRLSYRFDDPAGKVGIETLVVRDGSRLIQIVLSYREAALVGADEFFLDNMQHSALGTRWIYDGVGDPVAVAAFVRAIVAGEHSAILEFAVDGQPRSVETHVQAHGTGTAAAPEDIRVLGVEREGTVSSVQTTAGILRIPHLIEAGTPTAPLNLVGAVEGLEADVVLAEFEPVDR
jgi:hypothetical protein